MECLFTLNSATQVPFLFVFVGYLLITTGELFLSPIGLAKVTQLAPKKIIAFMMGVWFLSSTFAHYISGAIAKMTSEHFYNETATFVIHDGNKTNTYEFDFSFDYSNNLTNITSPSLIEQAKNEPAIKMMKDKTDKEKAKKDKKIKSYCGVLYLL